MKRITVDPYEVWCFYPHVQIIEPLAREIMANGWKNTPPVPLFEIPESLRTTEHRYMLASDGSHRWAAAFAAGAMLEGILYAEDEKIDAERDGICPLPRPDRTASIRFERMLFAYCYPDEVKRMMQAKAATQAACRD